MADIGQTASAWAPRILSVLRIITGLLFLEHGTMKFFNFPPSEMFANGTVPLFSLYGLAGALELVGGALIALGLLTRPVAFILSGESMRRAASTRPTMAASRRSCSASFSFISPAPVPAPGRSTRRAARPDR
jgi:hypothetical protein